MQTPSSPVPTGMAQVRSAKTGTKERRKSENESALTKRKRELDRIAQRSSRERTKNRISFLENKVRILEARENNEQFASVLETQENLLKNNTELKALLMKIRMTTDAILDPKADQRAPRICRRCSNGTPSPSTSSDMQQLTDETAEQANRPSDSTTMDTQLPQVTLPIEDELAAAAEMTLPFSDHEFAIQQLASCDSLPMPTPFDPNIPSDGPAILDTTSADLSATHCDFSMLPGWTIFNSWDSPPELWMERPAMNSPDSQSLIVPHEQKWQFCDGTFLRALALTKAAPPIDHQTSSPITPIQGILWGWHNIAEPTRESPGWAALRDVDERVFGTWCSKPQKIALMWVCSLVLAYRVEPTIENLEAIPAFLRPRPAQERLKHPLVIDFLIWPGLRDFLVFNHEAYTKTGEFSERFVNDFHFNWPFPEASLLDYDPATNSLQISDLFKQSVYDLRNWTMKPRFFRRYPELAYDIPCYRPEAMEVRS